MIWKQFTHLGNFPPELKARFNSFLTTEFDDSLSVEMQLRSIIKWCQGNFKTVDILIDFINDISNWLKQFENNFDTKLEDSVISVLSEWQASGKLDIVINEALQWQLDDYIATNEQDKLSINQQLAQTKQDLTTQLQQTEQDLTTQLQQTEQELNAQLDNMGVNIENFGANIQSPDNQIAIQNALNYAVENKLNLFIPNGTYMTSPRIIHTGVDYDLKIYGNGTLKIINGSVTMNSQMLFQLRNTKEVTITIEDLTVDMNARGNPLPVGADPYLWQHCHAFFLWATSGNPLNVNVNNVHVIDPIADGMNFSGVGDERYGFINISGFTSEGRTRSRSDICITGNFEVANIVNIDVDSLEVEINNPLITPTFNVSNFRVKRGLDIHLGTEKANGTIQNGVVYRRAYLWLYGGTISNVRFFLENNFRLAHSDVTFIDCVFMALSTLNAENFIYMTGNNTDSSVRFTNCIFDHEEGATFNYYFYKLHSGTNSKETVFKSAHFKGNKPAIYFRAGTLLVDNSRFEGSGVNIKQYFAISTDAVTGQPIVNRVELYNNTVLSDTGTLFEPTYDAHPIHIFMSGNRSQSGQTLTLTRHDKVGTIQLYHQLDTLSASQPPTEGRWVAGTVIRNTFTTTTTESGWVCTASGTPGTWKALDTLL